MSEYLQRLKSHWFDQHAIRSGTPSYQKILSKRLSLAEYRAFLRQLYHLTKVHPQALARLAARLTGTQRTMVKGVLRHAISDDSQQERILSDLHTLGAEEAMTIRYERPLPATTALIAYLHYLLDQEPGIGILGYLYHLESFATLEGETLYQALLSAGIPQEALTFFSLEWGGDGPKKKLKMTEAYLSEMIVTSTDLAGVMEAIRTSTYLHAQLIDQAILSGTEKAEFPIDDQELRRMKTTAHPKLPNLYLAPDAD